MNTTALILCGALGREVKAIVEKYGWQVDLIGVSALDHLYPEKIAPDVESRLLALKEKYPRVIVVFGDCGTMGKLDRVLAQHGIERIRGAHCYAMFSQGQFDHQLEEEPGTFFLTDFLVRAFHSTLIRGLGLDRYPELKDEYFRHYRRVVYLAQQPDDALLVKAKRIADGFFNLPLVVQTTGYGWLETELVRLLSDNRCDQ